VYPQIPPGFSLMRVHFLVPDGDGHAFCLHGIKNETGGHDPVTLANFFFSQYSGNAFFERSNQITCLEVQCTDNNGGVLTQGTSTDAPVAGGESADPLPPNTAVLVRKSTGVLGRNHRGRSYEPGVGLDRVDMGTGNLSDAAVTAIQGAFDAFFAAQVANSMPPYLLHRNPAVLPTALTNYFVEKLLATQRRRLRKAAHR
jgi:hypothetical protein